ncbi:MAG TPA: DUF4129 domain-containing protein [Acidimicrobiales bacterium]|nr:DUF4129 domain-containing protein [Acidimicrobiales bacterium]
MRWRSPNNPLPAAALAASEATWIALVISALVNTTGTLRMDVPYLALALPAAAGALVGRAMRCVRAPLWPRVVLGSVAGLAVIALGAGALASRSVAGAFGRVAVDPFSVRGATPSAVSTIAWLAVAVVVLRGVVLGLSHGSFRQIGRSAAWTGLAFLTLFIVLAAVPGRALHAATRGAGPLFVVYFLEVFLLGYVMRNREASSVGAGMTRGGDRRVWGAILLVPVIVVVGAGFLAAAALGAWGSGLTTAALDAGHALGGALRAAGLGLVFAIVHVTLGIAAGIGAIVGLFVHHPIPKGGALHAAKSAKPPKVYPPPKIPPFVGGIVAAGLLGGLAVLVIRHRPPRAKAPKVATPPELVSSVFTWGKLFALLFAAARRLLSRLGSRLSRRRAPRRRTAHPVGVRGDYRRVLLAAHEAGRGRSLSETPREFASRVAPELGEGAELLAGLTDRYERARYAGAPSEGGSEGAADVLVAAFAALVGGAADGPAVAAAGTTSSD